MSLPASPASVALVDHHVGISVTVTWSSRGYAFAYAGIAAESTGALADRVSPNGDLDLTQLRGPIRVRYVLNPNEVDTGSGRLDLWFETTQSVWINNGGGDKPSGPYVGNEFRDFSNGVSPDPRPRTVQFVAENARAAQYLYTLRVRAALPGQPPGWIDDDPTIDTNPPF